MDIQQLENAGQEPVKVDGLAIEPDDGGQTPQEPVEPQEPIQEPVEPEEPQEPIEPESDEHEDPMPQVQDPNAIRAWIGRREKRLSDSFDQKLNQIVGLITPFVQQQTQVQQQPTAPTQTNINIPPEEIDFINDPVGTFNKLAQSFTQNYIPQYNAQMQQQQAQKAQQILTGIEFLAKSDPLVKDESDKIIEIAKKVPVPANIASLDPTMAARMIFTEAQNIALREKVTKKINPLAGNKPTKQPIGSVTPTPPAKPHAPKVQLSDEILAVATKMGLTPEQAMEFLKD